MCKIGKKINEIFLINLFGLLEKEKKNEEKKFFFLGFTVSKTEER